MYFFIYLCTIQASSQELEEYYGQANMWIQLLDEEIKLGENVKEDDFLEEPVRSFI